MLDKVILGIDCDTNKIAAVVGDYKTGKLLDSFSYNREERWDGGIIEVVLELDRWIKYRDTKIKDFSSIVMVGIEDHAHHSPNPINSIRKGELMGVLKYYFMVKNIPMFYSGSIKKKKGREYKNLQMISPSRLRKYIPVKSTHGKSNNSFLWIYKKFGIEFLDDNLADAYVIFRIVRNVLFVESKKKCPDKLSKKQKEVIIDLIKERKNGGFGNYCLYGMKFKDGNRIKGGSWHAGYIGKG